MPICQTFSKIIESGLIIPAEKRDSKTYKQRAYKYVRATLNMRHSPQTFMI